MLGHRFWVLMGCVDLFSQGKIDSPKLFQPQGAPPQSLFLRYESEKRLRLVYRDPYDPRDPHHHLPVACQLLLYLSTYSFILFIEMSTVER